MMVNGGTCIIGFERKNQGIRGLLTSTDKDQCIPRPDKIALFFSRSRFKILASWAYNNYLNYFMAMVSVAYMHCVGSRIESNYSVEIHVIWHQFYLNQAEMILNISQ